MFIGQKYPRVNIFAKKERNRIEVGAKSQDWMAKNRNGLEVEIKIKKYVKKD